MVKSLLLAALSQAAATESTVAPVALLHGVDDSCPQTAWTDYISEAINNQAVVKCVEVGDGVATSIFERIKWQAATVCHKLHNDPDYAGKEINIVGISQGGLIARTVVERCADLNVHTLFTFGSPHNGISVY